MVASLSHRLLVASVVLLPLLTGIGCHRRSVPEVELGAHEIQMRVLKSRQGDTMALVPVWINGEGPFAFALDTGASHSVVDRAIAERLGLEASGQAEQITGVGGAARAVPVRVTRWRVGDVQLPKRTLAALDLNESDRQVGFQGLLGSDMLSKFEVVVVDYQSQKLFFRPPQGGLVISTK